MWFKKQNVYLLFAILLLLLNFSFAIDITACTRLTASGATYLLRAPVTSAQTCFNVTASNIVLQCERPNYVITGTNLSGRAGVNISSKGFTLQNCQLNNYDYDIYANGTTFSGLNTIRIIDSQANSTGHAALWVNNWDNIFTFQSIFNAKSQSTQGARIIDTFNIELSDSIFNCTVGSCYGAQIDTSITPYIHDNTFQSADSQAYYSNANNDSAILNNIFYATGKGTALYYTGLSGLIQNNWAESEGGTSVIMTTTARDNTFRLNTILSNNVGINTAGTTTNNLITANTFSCPTKTATAISMGGSGNNFTYNIVTPTCALPFTMGSSVTDNNVSFNNFTSNNTNPIINMPATAINSHRNHFENNNLTQGNNTASRNQVAVISIRSTSASNTSFIGNRITFYNGTGLLNVIGTSQNRMLNFTYNNFSTPATFNGAWVNNSDSSANFSTNTEIPPMDITATKVCNASAGTSGVCFNTNIQDNVNWSLDETTSVGSPYEANISITNTSLNDTVNIIYLSFYANYRTVGFAHHVRVNIWNGTGWDFTGQELAHNLPQWYNLSLYGTSYVKSNTVNVQFQHVQNGDAAHSGIDIDFIGLQVANYHQGNYYPNTTSYACYDVSGDGFCDVGTDWPFNQTTLGASLWCANGTDFGPAIARPITPTGLNWTGEASVNNTGNTSRYVLFSWNFTQVYPISGVSCILGVNGTNYTATVGMGTCSYLWDGEFNGYGQFNITGYVVNTGFGLSSTNKTYGNFWNYTLREPNRPTNCTWIEPALNNSNTTNMTQRFRWACDMNGTNISSCLLQVQNASGYFNVSGSVVIPPTAFCWQEQANETNGCGYSNGTYRPIGWGLAADSNWNTEQQLLDTYYINYTKPPNTNASIWGLGTDDDGFFHLAIINDTGGESKRGGIILTLGTAINNSKRIPQNCMDLYPSQVAIRIINLGGGYSAACEWSGGWADLGLTQTSVEDLIFEEAMYWIPTNACYQEFANQSTNCAVVGGNYSRSADATWGMGGGNALWDGDWTTGDYANCGGEAYLYANYTKPWNASGFVWMVSDGYANEIINLTPTSQCWNGDANKIRLLWNVSTSGGCISAITNFSCWNGTDWRYLWGNTHGWVYEEAVYWDEAPPFCEANLPRIPIVGISPYIINITGITANNNSINAYTPTWIFTFESNSNLEIAIIGAMVILASIFIYLAANETINYLQMLYFFAGILFLWYGFFTLYEVALIELIPSIANLMVLAAMVILIFWSFLLFLFIIFLIKAAFEQKEMKKWLAQQ